MSSNALPKAEEVEVRLRLANRSKDTLQVYLEPQGMAYSFEPGTVFDVVAKGRSGTPPNDRLEIEWAEQCVTVYGWSGSIVTFFRDGVELP